MNSNYILVITLDLFSTLSNIDHRNIKTQGITTTRSFCTGRVEKITLLPLGY